MRERQKKLNIATKLAIVFAQFEKMELLKLKLYIIHLLSPANSQLSRLED